MSETFGCIFQPVFSVGFLEKIKSNYDWKRSVSTMTTNNGQQIYIKAMYLTNTDTQEKVMQVRNNQEFYTKKEHLQKEINT